MSRDADKRFIEQVRHGMSEAADIMESILRDAEEELGQAELDEARLLDERIEDEKYEQAVRISELYRSRRK